MALLDVRDLRIDIPLGDDTLHAVRGLDLQVERGEMLCLVGESGCGKSTWRGCSWACTNPRAAASHSTARMRTPRSRAAMRAPCASASR